MKLKRNSIPDATTETVFQVAAVLDDGSLKICDHFDSASSAGNFCFQLSLKPDNYGIKFVVVEMERTTKWTARCTEIWHLGCTRDDAPTFDSVLCL